MSFWDAPSSWPADSWPSAPGVSVAGTVTRMAVRQSRYGRLTLCVELDGDGKERWCSTGLWRSMGIARVEPGDTIRVTRHDDGQGGARWDVTKGAPEAPSAVPTQAGPQW